MINAKDRESDIDIIKCIAICCVVLGHCGTPVIHFIYLFHMAVFFIAAGYCFNSKYIENFAGVKQIFYKRIKSLWFPYFMVNCIFVILNNMFIKCHIYLSEECGGTHKYLTIKDTIISCVKIAFFANPTELGGGNLVFTCAFFIDNNL